MIFFLLSASLVGRSVGFTLNFMLLFKSLMTWIACIMFFLLVIFYVKIHLVGGQKWNSTVTFGDKNINQQLFLLKGAFCSDTIYVTLCVPCSVSAQNQMDEGTKNRRQWRGLHSGFFKENVSTHSYTLIHTDWLSWLGIKKNHFKRETVQSLLY